MALGQLLRASPATTEALAKLEVALLQEERKKKAMTLLSPSQKGLKLQELRDDLNTVSSSSAQDILTMENDIERMRQERQKLKSSTYRPKYCIC